MGEPLSHVERVRHPDGREVVGDANLGILRPYFSLTVGATRFDPKVEDFGSEWRFSIGSGLGLKTYVSPRFGFRAEARLWPTFLRTSGGFLCSLPGACLVSVEADFIAQASATAGFFVAF